MKPKKKTTFTLRFRKEQGFDSFETYLSPMEDDTGKIVRFRGQAYLINYSQSHGREPEEFPYEYSFDTSFYSKNKDV